MTSGYNISSFTHKAEWRKFKMLSLCMRANYCDWKRQWKAVKIMFCGNTFKYIITKPEGSLHRNIKFNKYYFGITSLHGIFLSSVVTVPPARTPAGKMRSRILILKILIQIWDFSEVVYHARFIIWHPKSQ